MIDPDVNLETVGRLLALVAHDLRNPLSAIHSNLGFLSSTLLDEPGSVATSSDHQEEVRDALSDGLISCEGLTHMIDNIETLGQVLRGAQPPPRQTILAADVVQDAVNRCVPVAESYGIKLERVRSSSDLAHTNVFAAREYTCKALGNLIRNAVQHSSPGQTVSIALRGGKGAERLQIIVEDQGTPILPETMASLFSATGQVRAKGASDGRYSRALGLYVARLGAELGGGQVSAEMAPNSVTNTLILDLPLA